MKRHIVEFNEINERDPMGGNNEHHDFIFNIGTTKYGVNITMSEVRECNFGSESGLGKCPAKEEHTHAELNRFDKNGGLDVVVQSRLILRGAPNQPAMRNMGVALIQDKGMS